MIKLTFNWPAVLELIEHSKAASDHIDLYSSGKKLPGLYLVGDRGVYLMSSGHPHFEREDGKPGSKVVYADGCNPDTNSDWYDIKVMTFGGDDGADFMSLDDFALMQDQCRQIRGDTPDTLTLFFENDEVSANLGWKTEAA